MTYLSKKCVCLDVPGGNLRITDADTVVPSNSQFNGFSAAALDVKIAQDLLRGIIAQYREELRAQKVLLTDR